MVNDIINAISAKLYETFGDGYEIYKENIEQGLVEPCFSIVVLQAGITAQLPTRYLKTHAFDIHYFPKDKNNAKAECYTVAEELLMALEYINSLDNLWHGNKINYEIVDGVLHFFVNYDMFVKKQIEGTEHMQTVKTKSTVEG